MFKSMIIAAFALSLATSAMAAGGMKDDGYGRPADRDSSSSVLDPTHTDNYTTGSVTGTNGANGSVGSNSANSTSNPVTTKGNAADCMGAHTGTMARGGALTSSNSASSGGCK